MNYRAILGKIYKSCTASRSLEKAKADLELQSLTKKKVYEDYLKFTGYINLRQLINSCIGPLTTGTGDCLCLKWLLLFFLVKNPKGSFKRPLEKLNNVPSYLLKRWRNKEWHLLLGRGIIKKELAADETTELSFADCIQSSTSLWTLACFDKATVDRR